MTEPIVIWPGEGEIVGDAPDRRVEILSDHDAVHITWSRFGPGRDGADLHIHRKHTDLFYVLDGELTIRLGSDGEEVRMPAGVLARIPPLVVHGFRNASDAEVRYLNLHAPGQGFAGFMRGLRDGGRPSYDQEPPPSEGTRPSTDAVIGGAGQVIERAGLRATLLADTERVAIADVELDPSGAAAAAPRRHDRQVVFLYVLEGELAVSAGNREQAATAGTFVQVPARLEHTVEAAGDAPARFLDIRAPGPFTAA